jgi:hypothetical protein
VRAQIGGFVAVGRRGSQGAAHGLENKRNDIARDELHAKRVGLVTT